MGSACNVITATAGQLAVSGGSGSALTGTPDLTFSGHTFSTTASGIFDLSASTATNGLIVPSNSGNTASVVGAITYDTTSNNYHAYNSADSILLSIPAAGVPGNNVMLQSVVSGGKLSVTGTGMASANVVSASSNLPQYGVVVGASASGKGTAGITPNANTAFVLHSGGASANPAWSAIVAGDLPGTLSSGTAITNAALTTPDLGTPSALTLTNATGLPIAGISATGVKDATTYLSGDGSWKTATGSNGLSGMTLNYIPIAAGANTITSSIQRAGSGAGITTGTGQWRDFWKPCEFHRHWRTDCRFQ